MQQYTLQSNHGKLLQEGMYVIQLNNGEQHYVQATSAVLSSATPTATAITINPTDQLQTNAYLQTNQLGQIQTVQPHEATVVHHQQQQQHHQQQQTDTFQEVLDYIQHLYTEIAKEKNIRQYICLFCTQDFNDLRSLLRHTSFSHRTKILDGTISLEQDFDALVRKKLQAKEQQSQSQHQQLYQCVQCQQMFNSLEIISEHLAHCQPPSATISNIVPSSNGSASSYQEKTTTTTELINASPNKSHTIASEQYIPYGCAQCGRRYHTIRDLINHMRSCVDDNFYDAAIHLNEKNWVEAPKNQHIVINEEATNVVLKTTGLWLMPEPPGQQIGSDALRGFWVMPSSLSDYVEDQLRMEQEKLNIELEQKRLQEEQEERARLQREEEQNLLMQRQIIEQQHKLRLQQQLEEQQKQILLQQQLQRQSHSVVQTIAPNTVPIVKSSPTAVISHQNQTNIQTQRPHSTATNTIIVLNDDQIFSQTGTDALRCIQASDGSYHVIGNVDLNDSRQVTNATSVIAHTPPATVEPTTSTIGRKRRARTTKNTTYTQQNDSDLITLENVYQTTTEEPIPVTNNKTTNSKRRRNAPTVEQTQTMSIDTNQTVIQNVEAAEIPPQQYYLAYNDNGVLVPIDTTSTLVKNDTQNNAVDLSQEQYIIEDLDASRKAQQKRRNKPSARGAGTSTAASSSSQSIASSSATRTTNPNTSSRRANVTNTNASELSAYDIDDLSHLDKPISTEKTAPVVPIKPLKTKPQFMDSFFSFLMNRESNKL